LNQLAQPYPESHDFCPQGREGIELDDDLDAEKTERSLFTFSDLHWGQIIFFSEEVTSSSNLLLHSEHWYSNNGIF
jgi:hypothetical protein